MTSMPNIFYSNEYGGCEAKCSNAYAEIHSNVYRFCIRLANGTDDHRIHVIQVF